jgi:sugar phosphate isomerase/epimerase
MQVRQGFTVEGYEGDADPFAFAADRGFDFVELNAEHEFERGRVDPDAVAARLDDRGLDAVVHLPYRLDLGSPHEHVRDGACRELEAAIDTAAAMNAEKAVVHAESRVHADSWDSEEIRAGIYDSLRRLDAYGRERGVEVCAENLKSQFFDAGDFPDLIERTDAALCLDTGHAYATGQDAARQARLLREHGDRVSHIHLNDTRLTDDDEHLPVGIGRIDFGALADAIRETGWRGTCTHEVFSFGVDYAAHGKDAFDRLLA